MKNSLVPCLEDVSDKLQIQEDTFIGPSIRLCPRPSGHFDSSATNCSEARTTSSLPLGINRWDTISCFGNKYGGEGLGRLCHKDHATLAPFESFLRGTILASPCPTPHPPAGHHVVFRRRWVSRKHSYGLHWRHMAGESKPRLARSSSTAT